jgi:hypothetical protein
MYILIPQIFLSEGLVLVSFGLGSFLEVFGGFSGVALPSLQSFCFPKRFPIFGSRYIFLRYKLKQKFVGDLTTSSACYQSLNESCCLAESSLPKIQVALNPKIFRKYGKFYWFIQMVKHG